MDQPAKTGPSTMHAFERSRNLLLTKWQTNPGEHVFLGEPWSFSYLPKIIEVWNRTFSVFFLLASIFMFFGGEVVSFFHKLFRAGSLKKQHHPENSLLRKVRHNPPGHGGRFVAANLIYGLTNQNDWSTYPRPGATQLRRREGKPRWFF